MTVRRRVGAVAATRTGQHERVAQRRTGGPHATGTAFVHHHVERQLTDGRIEALHGIAAAVWPQKLHELSDVTRQLAAALPPTDLTEGRVELVLEFDGGGSTVYALPTPERADGEPQAP